MSRTHDAWRAATEPSFMLSGPAEAPAPGGMTQFFFEPWVVNQARSSKGLP